MDNIKSWFIIHLAISSVSGQYFDFFQDPYFKPYQVSNNQNFNFGNFYTTKKPVVHNNNGYNNYNSLKSTTKSSYTGEEKDGNVDQTTKERGSRRKTTTNSIFTSNYFTSTVKPLRKTVKHNNVYTKENSNYYGTDKPRNGNRKETPLENNFNPRQTTKNQVNIYYPTEKPKAYNNGYNNNQNGNNNYYNSGNEPINSYTTQNTAYRPGVRPAIVDGPPITNRPTTRWPNFETKKTTRFYYNTTRKPTNDRLTSKGPDDAIAFPGTTSVEPNFVAGVDEDKMTASDKRRYIELGERMCEKYRSLNTKQPQAIPLLPSPEPVRVSESCDASSVPLVVGGKVANIRDFPHMALLGWRKIESPGYSWKCGGSLISDQFVLTAAHCAYQERDNSVVMGPPSVVQFGSSFLDDPAALVARIGSIIKHPRYKLPSSYYDIALLKLQSKVKFSASIKPACLGSPPPAGDSIIATGWGQTQFGGEQSLELRSVRLPVWEHAGCARGLGTSRKLPRGVHAPSQLCAGDRGGGRDTCQGDSGGPAMIQDGCSWRVVAVTSLGRSCGAPDTPGLYATVQKAFIAAHVFGNVLNSDKNSNRNNRQNNYNDNNNENSKSNDKEVSRRDESFNSYQETTSNRNGYNGNNNYNNQDNGRSYNEHANRNNRQYSDSNGNRNENSNRFGNVNYNNRGNDYAYSNNNNDSDNRNNGYYNNAGNEGSNSNNGFNESSNNRDNNYDTSSNIYSGDSSNNGGRDLSNVYRTTTNKYNSNYYNGNGRIWQ